MGGSVSQSQHVQTNATKVTKTPSSVTKKASVTKKVPPTATAGAKGPPAPSFLVPEPPANTVPLQEPPDETLAEGAVCRKVSATNKMNPLPRASAARAAVTAPLTKMLGTTGTKSTTKAIPTVPMTTMPTDRDEEATQLSRVSSPRSSTSSQECKPPMMTIQSRFTTATAAIDDLFGRKQSEAPLRKMRREIAESNYKYRKRWETPMTVALPYKDLAGVRLKTLQGSSTKASKVTFSSQFTSDALLQFAREPANRVCALNFANGARVGGGYKTGAMAQEEDLCRRIPNLYSTLYQARKDRLYPFGPSTCATSSHPAKYSDVLFTPNLVLARLGEEDKYQFLPAAQQAKVAIITAAAPNINFAAEVYDLNLMYNTVQAILIGPKYSDPSITTLVLGAWGCGAFGGDPKDISTLFALALKDEILGRMYREIHFAIPDMDPSNQNAAVFKRTLREHGIRFSDL